MFPNTHGGMYKNMSGYFNDKYNSIDEFHATTEKVISIKISNRRKSMTTDELWSKIHYSHYVEGDNE